MRKRQTQTYYATSLWTDPQNLASTLSTVVGLLALPEVVALIPLRYMPLILAISGAASFILRTWTGVRPVAAIAPGQIKPIDVTTLTATQGGE